MLPAEEWGLTQRETEVMDAVVETGGVHKLVARRLGISARTIQAHINNIYDKAGCRVGLLVAIAWDRHRRHGTPAHQAAQRHAGAC